MVGNIKLKECDYVKKVLFIASTGGHLSELLQLSPIFKDYDYALVTEKTKSNMGLRKKYPKRVYYLISGTYTTLSAKLLYPFKFLGNCFKSLYLFFKLKPDVVITTGTHNTVPMCYIAHFFKKKVIFIETFANSQGPTRSGKMVYPIADCFIVQWEGMLEYYPKALYGGWIY